LWFKDVTEESGLNFVHDAGPVGSYFMPQIMGSGAAFLDFDNDGRLDIYLVQNGGPNSTSRNQLFRQGPDGRFTNVSERSGLDVTGYGMGVAVGDVNNDGWPDVLITGYGGSRLFLNNHTGTFTDVSASAGIDNPLWGASAGFVDYDRDGWLDIVITNYVDYAPSHPCRNPAGRQDYCNPNAFSGMVTKLYHNLGRRPGAPESAVRFEDVTVSSGLGRIPGPGLGVLFADFNGDRWPDIFVANDGAPNRIWINQKDGTFKEDAVARGIAYNGMGGTAANMGVAIGDISGSGLFDVFVTHLASQTHALWHQQPRGVFEDWTGVAKLSAPAWRGTGFGTVLGDFDQDGSLDLAIVNGGVTRNATRDAEAKAAEGSASFWADYAQRAQLFAGEGNGKFRDISAGNAPFSSSSVVARGLAVGDVDGDGSLDLLVTTVEGRARLFRNVAPQRGHWLIVRALDPMLRRDAYGAEITVHAGSRRWLSWINPASSYLSSNDPRAHFGLGASNRVDAIDVVWPDGSEEVFPGGLADRVVVLQKGEGRREP
jgi:hypothetical protein